MASLQALPCFPQNSPEVRELEAFSPCGALCLLSATYAAYCLEKNLNCCWSGSYSPILESVPLHFICVVLYFTSSCCL